MMALGYMTRYSGADAILGLAFAHTGVVYPFFAAMLGWLGVALTGSDTSSNVLFGSLQTITAQRLGLSPVLMAAANSSGGVMGKMIDAQSICVASTATGWVGHEWRILRFVFLAFDRARGVGGIADARAAVRVPVDDRGAVRVGGAVLGMTRGCARNDSNASLSSNRRLRINARGAPRGPVARQRGDDEE